MSSIFFVGLFSICTPYKVFLNLLPILIGWVFLLLYLTTEFIQFLINTGIKPYIQVLFFFFFNSSCSNNTRTNSNQELTFI